MSDIINIESPATVVVIDQENVNVTVQENQFDVVLAESGVQGPAGPQGPAGDDAPAFATYVHNQNVPSSTWTIAHNLACYPAVAVVDSAANVVYGDVNYVSNNVLTVTFSGSFSGQAFLN